MEEKKTNNTKKGILIGCGISALLLTGFIGSYAYFMGNFGSNKQEEVSTQAGTLALTFADGNNGITEALEFGGSVEKTFNIENTGSLDAMARIMWDDLANTYIDGSLTYTLSSSDTETGTYTNVVENQNVPVTSTSSKELLAGNLSIPTGSIKYYKLTITLNYLDDIDQTADLKASLSTHFSVEESDGKDLSLAVKQTLKRLNKTVREENPNFAEPATTDETSDGLYQMEDDYGTSYFYRGAVEDNYVKFGRWSETSSQTTKRGKDMYWRIIRVNGDGSVRMIYDGTEAHTNDTNSDDELAWLNQKFNSLSNDAKYVGYMYGPANAVASTTTASISKVQAQTNIASSDIKTKLEEWYVENLVSEDVNIADNIFCYDRTTPGKEATGWSNDTGEGYGLNDTAYGAYARVGYHAGQNGIAEPKFTCENKNDAFTKEDTENGNGALEQKIGLITADEVVTAGSGKFDTDNYNYYLSKNKSYWTGSPAASSSAGVFVVEGFLATEYIHRRYGVAPVISLTPEYFNTLIGDGTIGNEYRES